MCGFAGFLKLKNNFSANALDILSRMSNSLIHRGPDDAGLWLSDDGQIGLSHRRLSILDLSEKGKQPMLSCSERFVIVYNGEIYNHIDLRTEIEDTLSDKSLLNWCGHSDTETLLAGIEFWGIEKTLRKAVGMFSMAIWDKLECELTLVRDRVGEKPLYYGWQNGFFLFGSELKALRSHPAFNANINRDAITLQMRHNYIPAPYSIYSGIYKLTPGCTLKLKAENPNLHSKPTPFWSLCEVIKNGKKEPFEGNEQDAITELEKNLLKSVKGQMLSDVPLGAFLSGGIDSSLIVALMQVQSKSPVKTFTIGFNEKGYNEANHAKAVARHLGTDHTELYVTAQEALDVIPKLPTLYDEPFSDSSQIPTYLVSEITQRHVSVSLSGDGGDELFGGYNRYFLTEQWWNKITKIPFPLRSLIFRNINLLTPKSWDMIGSLISLISNSKTKWRNLGNLITKVGGALNAKDEAELYRTFISHWQNPEGLVLGGIEHSTIVTDSFPKFDSIVDRMMFQDTLSYLPDDILCKVDRAAMGVSLETRVPMLDHRIIEFAWKLPLKYKIKNNQGKWILHKLLHKHIPVNLVNRPKMGFGVPIDSWLRGPLRDWAESLLNEKRLVKEGFFEPSLVREKWTQHLSGKGNWQYYLWDILMFQSWLELNKN